MLKLANNSLNKQFFRKFLNKKNRKKKDQQFGINFKINGHLIQNKMNDFKKLLGNSFLIVQINFFKFFNSFFFIISFEFIINDKY